LPTSASGSRCWIVRAAPLPAISCAIRAKYGPSCSDWLPRCCRLDDPLLEHAPLPILPLQIPFRNLIPDVFPALVLGVGPGDPTLMQRKPRSAGDPIHHRSHWAAIAGCGVLITMAALGAFSLASSGSNWTPTTP
jgi:hypothetical protein